MSLICQYGDLVRYINRGQDTALAANKWIQVLCYLVFVIVSCLLGWFE